MTDSTSPNDHLVIERTFDAPASTIWRMWTEPEHFSAWYGPMGATIPTADMDVTVGGKRLIGMQMQTPNGEMKMWFTGEYRVVDPTDRLVYTESMADETGRVLSPAEAGMPDGHPEVTEVIVELEEVDGRTKMVMTHRGVAPDSGGAMGWKMALDKLDTYVGGL